MAAALPAWEINLPQEKALKPPAPSNGQTLFLAGPTSQTVSHLLCEGSPSLRALVLCCPGSCDALCRSVPPASGTW